MKRFLYSILLLLLAHFGFLDSLAAAQLTDAENAKTVAKRDYVSAQAKILQDYKHATDECSKRTGPAEKECKIQALATRDAAEEDAKVAVDRPGYTVPLPDHDRKKASDDARARAKEDYKVALAKVMHADRSANMECSKLDGQDRKTCATEVATRTANAKRHAEYNYGRDIERAKAMKVP
ncbi:hypothetical protein ABC383_15720 [Noviherbaspirillum sp. 1P10PC]|uniref:hypothetical protein n=1 Tax=Noviherbaspirillum sp. 1P10PC TaxID=3132292 RepID=UPI0039A085C9